MWNFKEQFCRGSEYHEYHVCKYVHTHTIHMILCIHYSRLNVFILCWNSNFQRDCSWRWGLWGWIGHKDRDFLNRTRALIKEAGPSQLPCPFHRVRAQKENTIYEPEIGPSLDTEPASTLTLDFPDYKSPSVIFCYGSPNEDTYICTWKLRSFQIQPVAFLPHLPPPESFKIPNT